MERSPAEIEILSNRAKRTTVHEYRETVLMVILADGIRLQASNRKFKN